MQEFIFVNTLCITAITPNLPELKILRYSFVTSIAVIHRNLSISIINLKEKSQKVQN